MTAQVPDLLNFRGGEYQLCTNPLHVYLATGACSLKFYATSTALWRGYVATWSIENDHLYLIKLQCWIKSDDGTVRVAELAALFPDYPDGVFAHWFTGALRCPNGPLLKYVHGGYASTYEKDLVVVVRQGVVQEERLIVNGQAAAGAPEEYFHAGWTVFGYQPPRQD
jgi:hypothetical protein